MHLSDKRPLPSELTLDYTPDKAGTYEITDVVQTDDLADEIAQSEASKLTVTPGRAQSPAPLARTVCSSRG